MLSQVERGGRNGPTLAVATEVRHGLELSLSQLLRLDEGSHAVVTSSAQAGASRGGHRVEELTPPLPGQRAELSLHALDPGASTGGAGLPAHARARQSRDGRRPQARRRRSSSTATVKS